MFMNADAYPPVTCPRCERVNGETYTVPLRLVKPGMMAWQVLCGDCFRSELGVEPWDDLVIRPGRSRRSRRR